MANGEQREPNLPLDDAGAGSLARDGEAATARDPGKLAHDLRNFLAPVHNAVQVLRLRAAADPSLLPLADMIDRQVAGMRKLIDGMGAAEAADTRGTQARSGLAASAMAGQVRAQGETGAGRNCAGVRLLVVDDNAAFRDSLTGVLRDLGHNTREAPDGSQALVIARDWTPDLVFIDVNMPGLNGYELARRFRSEFSSLDIKLVMLSGDNLTEAAARGAEAAGFDRCMDKLSSVDAFRGLLDALFARAA
jgi:CheY-like chemotaxis protein